MNDDVQKERAYQKWLLQNQYELRLAYIDDNFTDYLLFCQRKWEDIQHPDWKEQRDETPELPVIDEEADR